MENTKLRVTVVCVTYNHEKYIAQALDGILMQKTNFDFEVLVGDDASTDKTPEIVREYAKKHPDIIKPVLRRKNIGAAKNSIDLYKRVKTEYVAICDGDDYWSDPYKLQKQVNFLDKHKDYGLCFSKVKMFYEDHPRKIEIIPNDKFIKNFFKKGYLTASDLLKYNFIAPVSVVWRWKFKDGLPKWYNEHLTPGDLCMHLVHSRDSKIGLINEVTAAYRRQKNGVWYVAVQDYNKIYKKYGIDMLEMISAIIKYYNGAYLDETKSYARYLFNKILDIAINEDDFYLYNQVLKKHIKLYDIVFNQLSVPYKKTIRHKFINVIARCLLLPKPYGKR